MSGSNYLKYSDLGLKLKIDPGYKMNLYDYRTGAKIKKPYEAGFFEIETEVLYDSVTSSVSI